MKNELAASPRTVRTSDAVNQVSITSLVHEVDLAHLAARAPRKAEDIGVPRVVSSSLFPVFETQSLCCTVKGRFDVEQCPGSVLTPVMGSRCHKGIGIRF